MKKLFLAASLFWAAFAHASSFIVTVSGVSVAGGSRIVIAAFINNASGVFVDSDPWQAPTSALTGTNAQFDFEYNEPFSVGMWALPSSNILTTGGHGTVLAGKLNISSDGGASTYRGWWFGTGGVGTTYFSQDLFFVLGNTLTNRIVIAGPPATWHDGQYNFVVATYDGSGTAAGLKLYVNKTLLVTNPAQTVDSLGGHTIRNSAAFAIGALTMNSNVFGSGEGYFNYAGNLNQITVWNTELSQGQIDSLYGVGAPNNPQVNGPSANLVSYYPLVGTRSNPLVTNDDTASTIYDAVGSNNLTNTNVALTGHTSPYPSYQNVSSGVFDGSNSNVNLGNNLGTNVATSAVSYSLWVNMAALPSVGAHYTLLNKFDGSGHGLILYTTNSSGDRTSFHFKIIDNSGTAIAADGPTGVFTPGQWTNLVVTYNGNQVGSGIGAFANGVPLTMTVTSAGPLTDSADNSGSFLIGMKQGGTEHFYGLLDEFGRFNRVLSSEDASSIYQSGTPGSLSGMSGLTNYYRFESAGQYDASYTVDNSFNIGDRAAFAIGVNNLVGFSDVVPPNAYSVPAAWTPASLPGLTMWMDATDNATITGGSPATAWTSKSLDATVYTAPAGYEPSVLAATINGKQVMSFESTGGHGELFIGPDTTALINNTDGWYVYGVFQNIGGGIAAAGPAFIGAMTDAGHSAYMAINDSESYYKLFFGGPSADGWQQARLQGASPLNLGNPFEIGFESTAGYADVTKMSGYINGTRYQVSQTGANTGGGGNRTAIAPTSYSGGGASIGASGLVGYIGEIIVGKTPGGLSASDRAKLHAYLLNKWGV